MAVVISYFKAQRTEDRHPAVEQVREPLLSLVTNTKDLIFLL